MNYFYLVGAICLIFFVQAVVILYYFDKKTKEFTDTLDVTIKEVWDSKVADTIEQLTSEDLIADTMAQMSDEQIDRIAAKVQELRMMTT